MRKSIRFLRLLLLFLPVLFFLVPGAVQANRGSTEKRLQSVLKKLYTVKKYEEAVELTKKYIEANRNNFPPGRLALLFGKVLMKSPDPYDWRLGTEAFRWAYITDEKLVEEGLFHFSESLRARGYLDEGLHSYRRFLDQFPRSVFASEARLKCADLLVRVDRADEAVDQLEAVLESPAFRGRALLVRMKAFAAMGKFPEADEALLEASREDPDLIQTDPDALVIAARVQLERGLPDESRFYAEAVESRYPDSVFSARASLVLAELMLRQKRVAEAEHYYNVAREKEETAPHAILGLQRILLDRGKFEEARQRGEDVLTGYPYFKNVRQVEVLTGRSLAGQGKVRDALIHFRKGEAFDELIQALITLNQLDPDAFLAEYLLFWEEVRGEMEIGEILLEHGKLEHARQVFKDNLMGKQQNRALRNLAHVYMKMGFDGLARDFLGDLIRRGAKDDQVYRLHGRLSARGGYREAALSSFERIGAKTGDDWLRLGRVYEKLGKSKKALAAYGQAIRKEGGDAYLARAELLLRKGKGGKALTDYVEARKASVESSDRLWATYRAARLSGDAALMKDAAETGGGIVAKVARTLVEENRFRKAYGGNRALK